MTIRWREVFLFVAELMLNEGLPTLKMINESAPKLITTNKNHLTEYVSVGKIVGDQYIRNGEKFFYSLPN